MFEGFAGSDAESAREMAQLFIERSHEYFVELQHAFQSNDSQEWKEVAHKMKGMAGFSGTMRLQLLCKTAQDNYEFNPPEKQSLLTAIESELEDAVIALKHYLETMN